MQATSVMKHYILVVILVKIQLSNASHRIDIIKAEHLQLNKQKVDFWKIDQNRILINF